MLLISAKKYLRKKIIMECRKSDSFFFHLTWPLFCYLCFWCWNSQINISSCLSKVEATALPFPHPKCSVCSMAVTVRTITHAPNNRGKIITSWGLCAAKEGFSIILCGCGLQRVYTASSWCQTRIYFTGAVCAGSSLALWGAAWHCPGRGVWFPQLQQPEPSE